MLCFAIEMSLSVNQTKKKTHTVKNADNKSDII